MGYYDSEIDYYEPSEFEEECENLKQMLRESVSHEIQQEIASLKIENARMKDIVNNYDTKVKELESAKQNYIWNKGK